MSQCLHIKIIYDILIERIKYVKNSIINRTNDITQKESQTFINTYDADSKNIYPYFIDSVLEGEYTHIDFGNYLNNIKSESNDIISVLESTLSESYFPIQSSLLNEIKEKKYFNIFIEFAIFYEHLYMPLSSRKNNENKLFLQTNYYDYILNNSIKINDENYNEEDFHKNQTFFFCTALYLAQLDEGYVCDREKLYEIVNISDKVYVADKDPVFIKYKNIHHKCKFLIYKLLKRLNKTDKNNFIFLRNKRDELSTGNNDFTEYSTKSLETHFQQKENENPYYKNYYNLIQNNYDKLNIIFNAEEKIAIIKEHLINDDIKIQDCHYLCKLIKNLSIENYTIVENFNTNKLVNTLLTVMKEYERKLISLKSNSDKNSNFYTLATDSGLFLIQNSLILLETRIQISEAEKTENISILIKSIKKLEDMISNLETQIDIQNENFHKHFQSIFFTTELLHFISDSFKSLFIRKYNNTDAIIKSKYNEALQKLSEFNIKFLSYSTKCIKLISIAEDKKLMPIYLSKNEQIDANKLFADSGYIFPPNYNHLRKKLDESINRIKLYDFDLKSTIYIDKVDKVEDGIKKTFDDKIKESQINAIQIVALYAGFITFILSTVSIIPKFEHSYKNMFLFLLIFSSCICMFIFLIRFIFGPNITRKEFFFGIYEDGLVEKKYLPKELLFTISFFIVFLLPIALMKCDRENDSDFRLETTEMTTHIDKNGKDSVVIKDVHSNSNYVPPKEDKK